MRKKTTRLLAFAVLAAAGLAAAPPGALARRNSAARSCAKIAADAERLACYDRLFRSARVRRRHKESAAPSSSARVAPARDDSAAAARRESAAPVRHEAAAAHAEQKAPARREAAKTSAGASKSGGLEVTIVKVRRIRQIGEAFFVTDDGHVWRQTDQRQTIFPKPPFRAVISTGFLGSHFLSPVGKGVSVQVSEEPQ